MREFYIFDGEDFIECSEILKEDLIELCEDNKVMLECIKDYFEKGQLSVDTFKEKVYEIAFGDNAINRDFTEDEVLEKLKYYNDTALKFEIEQEEI